MPDFSLISTRLLRLLAAVCASMLMFAVLTFLFGHVLRAKCGSFSDCPLSPGALLKLIQQHLGLVGSPDDEQLEQDSGGSVSSGENDLCMVSVSISND